MRVATVLHELFYPYALGHYRPLGQECQLPGQCLGGETGQRLALDIYLALLQRQLSRQQLEQGGFAAAIWPDDANQLAPGQAERYIVQNRFLVIAKLQIAYLQNCHQSRSEEHTSELQSRPHLVCRLLLEKKKNT